MFISVIANEDYKSTKINAQEPKEVTDIFNHLSKTTSLSYLISSTDLGKVATQMYLVGYRKPETK